MFGRRSGRRAGQGLADGLYARAVAASREAVMYAALGAPDTVEGRFELLTLYVILLIERLGAQDELAQSTRQRLFDLYIGNLDGALREMGVGDLVVGKRMKALGGLFYGRAHACEAAFAALPDRAPFEDLVARTVMAGLEGADAGGLADHLLARRAAWAKAAWTDLAEAPVARAAA